MITETNEERQKAIEKYFYKTNLYWVRYRGGYRFSEEEMSLSIDHYLQTGEEP